MKRPTPQGAGRRDVVYPPSSSATTAAPIWLVEGRDCFTRGSVSIKFRTSIASVPFPLPWMIFTTSTPEARH